jgi:hypothetical protein
MNVNGFNKCCTSSAVDDDDDNGGGGGGGGYVVQAAVRRMEWQEWKEDQGTDCEDGDSDTD